MTLLPIRRLRERSSGFAWALLERYGLRARPVRPVRTTLLHARGQQTQWRVHLELAQRSVVVRVAPQLTFTLLSSPDTTPAGAPRRSGTPARREASVQQIETVFMRRMPGDRTQRLVDASPVREPAAVVQRALARGVRLDASPKSVPGIPGTVYAPPPVEFVLAGTRSSSPAPPRHELEEAAARAVADAATASWPGALPAMPPQSDVPAAHIDVEHLTDSVLQAIDDRVIARRERLGRV